jgi:hypothetical protein
LLAWCLLLGLLASGCGGKMATVTGTVTFAGPRGKQPLPDAVVQFMGSDGIPYSTRTGSDGTYSTQVAVGEARVLVSAINEAEARKFGNKILGKFKEPGGGVNEKPLEMPPRDFSLIPKRYGSWDTSGLKVTVTRGTNTHNFDLTP